MLLANLLAELNISRIRKALKANDYARAGQLARKFVTSQPSHARAWFMLGEAARGQHQNTEALRCYNQALALQPENADTLLERGLLLIQSGELDAGLQDLFAAHAVDTTNVTVAASLSGALLSHGRPDLAEHVLLATLQYKPDAPELSCNLALVRLSQQRPDEAIDLLQRSLRNDPSHRSSRLNLGHALVDQLRTDEAQRVFTDGLTYYPNDPDILAGLATVAYTNRDYAVALSQLDAILAQHPDHLLAQMFRGLTLRELRRYDEAVTCFRALTAHPTPDPSARINLSFVLLAQGRYAEGWTEYEARRQTPETPGSVFPVPDWDGQPLRGALLLYGEQGLGDEIMFASCVPDAITTTSPVILQCDMRLGALFQRSFPRARVVATDRVQREKALQPLQPFVAQLAVGSLPRLFRRSRSDFPTHGGYLKADPAKIAKWRDQLGEAAGGLRIGLCWRGGMSKLNITTRSIPLVEWLPILTVPNTQFFSLQHGNVGDDLAALKQTHNITVRQFAHTIDDVDELAALIGALDLVISVQSTTVHLTGALGRPCWALVPFSPEWRYQTEDRHMPWYPSVEVFRQTTTGVWPPVLEAVAAELRRTIQYRR